MRTGSTQGRIDSLRKQKHQRLDAKRPARKLPVAKRDPLPEAWFPPAEIRQLRLRARQRCWLAVLRTQVKNRLQSLLQMHGLRPAVKDVFGASGRVWLAAPALREATQEIVEQLLRVHDFLGQEVEKAEGYLRAVDRHFPELARLRTLPGIGEILAPVIRSISSHSPDVAGPCGITLIFSSHGDYRVDVFCRRVVRNIIDK